MHVCRYGRPRFSLFVMCGPVVLFAGAAGCSGPEVPSGVSVSGKIVFERGGTVKGLYDRQALIEFESVDQPGVRAYGEINEDGSFTLASLKDGVEMKGMVEGAHRGRLNLDEEVRGLVAPRFLSFESSGITIRVPNQEEIVIKVWR